MMPSASPFQEGGLCCIKSDPVWECDEYMSYDELMYSVNVQPNTIVSNMGHVTHSLTPIVNHNTLGMGISPDDHVFVDLGPYSGSSTANKPLPLAFDRILRNGWKNKMVVEWDENDTIDWLFETAKELEIPQEQMLDSRFNSLKGTQLMHMSLSDFQDRDPTYGKQFYDAFQRYLHQTQQFHNQQSTLAENTPNLLGLTHRDHNALQNALHLVPMIPNETYEDVRPVLPQQPQHHHPPQQQQQHHHHHHLHNNNNTIPGHTQGSGIYMMNSQDGHQMSMPLNSDMNTIHPSCMNANQVMKENFHSTAIHRHDRTGHEDYETYTDSQPFDQSEYLDLDTEFNFSGGTPSDQEEAETLPKRVGRPAGKTGNRRRKPDRGYGKLWEFIRDLLHNPTYCPSMVRWENVEEGVFRIVKSEQLAQLWGTRKNNPRMTYEKLSRAMRYYYKSKVFMPVLGRRLVYKFGPNAVRWRPEDPNFELQNSRINI